MNHVLMLFMALFFISCDEWLSLSPKDNISETKLFETEEGFKSLLDGTYVLMAASSAYGFELLVGFPDEVVRLWQEKSKFYTHDYTDEECKNRLLATWSQMYKAIANNNILIEHLRTESPESLKEYNVLLGEALGLRAYIHLDLLQIYGPTSLSDGNQKAIPYRKYFDNTIQKIASVDTVLNCIERDLLEAERLLHEVTFDENGNLVATIYRYRLNYFAVCATLAKFYLLKADKKNARMYAEKVIESSFFELAKREDYVVSELQRDLMFTRELVFGVYSSKMKERVCDKIEKGGVTVDPTYRDEVYQNTGYGKTDDVRFTYLWKKIPASIPFEILNKYRRVYSEEGGDISVNKPYMPLVRLSEMYYIASEAYIGTDNVKALELLNTVRLSRKLDALPDHMLGDKQILDEIVNERRKDLWGEGKMLFLYKRLYRDIDVYQGKIPASEEIFEFPIPDKEYEFGNN